jgi:thiamine monophosphate kinase
VFLDYIGINRVVPRLVETVVRGIAAGCREAGCALIGGEIAELPDFLAKGEYDLAGFALGVVERRRLIDGRRVRPGDVVIGLLSNGLHSNGFSLARKVVFERLRLKVRDPIRGAQPDGRPRVAETDPDLRQAHPEPPARRGCRFARWRTSRAAGSRGTCRASFLRVAAP